MNLTSLRLVTLAGHYGSGKTHIAVNLALYWRKRHAPVSVVDLDIVNPYYRTKDAAALLRAADVGLISSPYAGSNLDAPAVPPEVERVFDDPSLRAVLDVGGDDRGALALGRYAERISSLPGRAVWWVTNCYRPLTARTADALAVMREIEAAGRIRFTGLVNNANLGPATTPDDVLASLPYAAELSQRAGLPVVMTAVREDLYPALEGAVEVPFPIRIFRKPEWVLL